MSDVTNMIRHKKYAICREVWENRILKDMKWQNIKYFILITVIDFTGYENMKTIDIKWGHYRLCKQESKESLY